MTNDVGAVLRAAREQRGLTLAQAEEGTKIRQRFLQALEENDHSVLGGTLYVRGFLRNYATFLGLDAAELMPAAVDAVPIIAPPPSKDAELLSLPLRDTSFPFGRIIFMVVAFLLLGLAAYYFWQPTQRAALIDQFAAYLPIPTATLTPISAEASGTATVTVVRATATESALIPLQNTPTTTPVPTATLPPRTPTPDLTVTAVPPTNTPEPVQGIVLSVNVTAPSWTEVYLDNADSAVLARTLSAGETFEWTGQQSVFLRLGNAGGVVVTLNGQELGTLGGSGAVVNREWVIDPATGQPVESTN